MIFHALTAILILLQVTGIINVSWWLVLAPSLVVGFIATIFLLISLVAMVKLTK